MEFINNLFEANFLLCILFFLSLIALFFWPEGKEKGENAWDILHKKLAEGRLTVEEYQERKSLLEHEKRK